MMDKRYLILILLNIVFFIGTVDIVFKLEKQDVHQPGFRTVNRKDLRQDETVEGLSKGSQLQAHAQTSNAKVNSELEASPQSQQKTVPVNPTKAATTPAHDLSSKGSRTPGSLYGLNRSLSDPAIVLFCFNRTEYLHKTLESLSQLRGLSNFSVYISQDGNSSAVAELLQSFGASHFVKPKVQHFEHWQRERIPQLGPKQPGHAWLTQHYKYGLDRIFLEKGHSHVIIVEDDMLFSPDFLTFFEATAPLLDADPSLWCVSTWNDNGLRTFEWDAKKMFRTSYFPGLGWMMRRQLWEELGPRWPTESWDHWMRLDTTAKGRDCIVPEVNRNKNIGEKGANMDKRMYKRYLSVMNWNQAAFEVSDYGDLSYLLLEAYKADMQQKIHQATPWEWRMSRVVNTPGGGLYLMLYKLEDYTRLASQFRTWPFPRGHFRNVGYLKYKGSMFLLADQRFCDLLDKQHRIWPSGTLSATAAERNESCDKACGRVGRKCSKGDFWFINSCQELRKHFPCEGGCEMVLGLDVPNYVLDPQLETYQKCLVTQQQSRCAAQHHSTARLCPCV